MHGRTADAVVPQHWHSGVYVVLCKDKTAGAGGSIDRTGQMLFIDARNLGHMVDRAERAFSDDDIAKIANTFRAWRGTKSATDAGLTYEDEAGFSYSTSLAEVKAADYALTPGRYVGAAVTDTDGEEVGMKIQRQREELLAQFAESERLAVVVRKNLGRIDG